MLVVPLLPLSQEGFSKGVKMALTEYKAMRDKKLYQAPQFEIVECSVEFGFANTLGDPFQDPEMEW